MTGMSQAKGKRRILTAGVGIAAITALEGLACGNPVAPSRHQYDPEPEPQGYPHDAMPADPLPTSDAGVETPPVEPTP
jgi:hypothetical protein